MNEFNQKYYDSKIKSIEKDVEGATAKLDKIMTNHLPHLDKRIASLSTRVTMGITINVLLVAGYILTQIIVFQR